MTLIIAASIFCILLFSPSIVRSFSARRSMYASEECGRKIAALTDALEEFCSKHGRMPSNLSELAEWRHLNVDQLSCPHTTMKAGNIDDVDHWSTYRLLVPDWQVSSHSGQVVALVCTVPQYKAEDAYFMYLVAGVNPAGDFQCTWRGLAWHLSQQTNLGFSYECSTNLDGRLDIQIRGQIKATLPVQRHD